MHNKGIAFAIHNLPAHVLSAAVRGDRGLDATTVRQEFVSWVVSQRDEFTSWQEAWNAWTGAHQSHPGRIEAYILCQLCRGRMFDIRTGVPRPCPNCVARKRVWARATALWQPIPAP
jgi:hypothetical protein